MKCGFVFMEVRDEMDRVRKNERNEFVKYKKGTNPVRYIIGQKFLDDTK